MVLFHTSGMRLKRAIKRAEQTLAADWRGSRSLSFGLIVLVVTAAVVLAYVLNNPQPNIYPDTKTYLKVTHRIFSSGDVVDLIRTPGYPLVIAMVFLVAGQGNLTAVILIQSLLFVLAVLEIYVLTILLFRRSWVALGIGLLLGSNSNLLSFAVRPILSEGLALFLVASLALAVIAFLRTWQLRLFWLIAALTLALFMTRPEWIYLPVPLLLYLLVMARRHGRLRRLLPHSLAAVVLLYSVLGFYIYQNAAQNGYAGVTVNQRANLLGKIMQYGMQNEAPTYYASIAQVVNTYMAQGGVDPDELAAQHPELEANNWVLAGAYSQAIIASHPVEYGLHTAATFFSSCFYSWTGSQVNPQGAFATVLLGMQPVSADVYRVRPLVPLFLLFWGILLFWRRTSHLQVVEQMGALVLLVLYDLLLIAAGGYTDYMRLHVPIGPLFMLLIWGSFLASLPYWKPAIARLRLSQIGIWLLWGGMAAIGVIMWIAVTVMSGTWASLSHPDEWEIIDIFVVQPSWLLIVAVLAGVFLFLRGHSRRPQQMRANVDGSAEWPVHRQATANFEDVTTQSPGCATQPGPEIKDDTPVAPQRNHVP